MINRILRLLLIYATYILLFILAKPIFVLANFDTYGQFGYGVIYEAIYHGLSMDLSMGAYLTVIPAIMLIASIWTSAQWPQTVTCIWRYTSIALVTLAVMADTVLYQYWHFKLDVTPIFYFISSPSSALASVDAWIPWVALFAATAITWLLGWSAGRLWNIIPIPYIANRRSQFKDTIVCTFLTALLFIPIRGGVTVSTMNPSAAYYSNYQEKNHAAVNPMFSILYSATHQNNFAKEFRFFSNAEKEALLEPLTPIYTASDSTLRRIIDKHIRPDIYIIILESFSSHLMPMLGGEPVALCLDSIARQGITFTNFYASSFRTDRAIPAILSGYPAQPTTSIMKFVDRTDNLPSIAGTLRDSLGYSTAYYYGGDINFVNQKAYLVSSGFETIVSDRDFPLSKRLSKWGAHDGVVFDRLWSDLKTDSRSTTKTSRPALRVLQTSSSHEPFEVPFTTDRFTDERATAFAYADSCLGNFVRNLKSSPRWKKSLLIIVPDHWGAYPRGLTNQVERHSIPLVITGGVTEAYSPATIDTPAAQSDIAATLLSQLGINSSAFPLSHNFLDSSQKQYAFFSEPDFAALVTETDTVAFAIRGEQAFLIGSNKMLANTAKAFLQNLYDDISKR